MNNTALGAVSNKKENISFISEAHEKFYYEKLKELSRENNGMPNLGYVTTMDFLFHKDEIKPSEVTNLLREMYAVKK